ncbi:MAG: cadmium-translocating P-type ATPase [Burkholderiaceae bacterium]|jgi:Cd2+/Zn2+-exporting ATPase|nr:cadmium-translocating P-type ATPase [Burkholderiaceae bacterium]
MLKEYSLQGLDCAGCAAKIEKALGALDGVSSATLNFMTTSLQLEVADFRATSITAEVRRVVQTFEPDVTVTEKADRHVSHDHPAGLVSTVRQIAVIAIGALLLGIGWLISLYYPENPLLARAIFVASYLIPGAGILWRALKSVKRGLVFDENFLMGIATIGALAIGEYPEAVAVMLLYRTGEYFQDKAVNRSRKSITNLMGIRPDFARVKQGNDFVNITPDSVKVGDTILVKPGERIPLDGIVLEGISTLDTTALTGESVPRKVKTSDTALSGCINQSGVLLISVTKRFGESTAARIIDLVENAANKKAPTENFITRFSQYYTPIVVSLAFLLAVVPPLFGAEWRPWLHRGMIFLVISCPCALVVSVPLSFFSGIGLAGRKGILVKGGNYLEALGMLDIVALDKTGTLTKGVFRVTEILPTPPFTAEALLKVAAHAEAFSNHPIALSIRQAYGKPVDSGRTKDCQEVAGQGISAQVDGKTALVGNRRLLASAGIACPALPEYAGTEIHVAMDGALAGSIVIADEIRPDSATAIAGLRQRGVRKILMLTGDNARIARTVADTLGLDAACAELLPWQKIEKVEALGAEKRVGGKLAFVGDGINDAPVLARADVGIAMGALGSDAAIEAADIVLMTDEPSRLAEAIDIARTTQHIVWQNVVFALGTKCLFLLLGALGIASLWEAVFADVGVSLIAVLNATRLMRAA